MTLADLARHLDDFASGRTRPRELRRWLDALLSADVLGVDHSDSTPWDAAPDDARLFWRLVYRFDLVEGDEDGDERDRRLARRVVDCLTRTRSSATTFEMLPVITDQDRLCAIVVKCARGIISRTGFLSVLAESGYPPHVKLWLEHAEPSHLARLCDGLERGAYDDVAAAFERVPE